MRNCDAVILAAGRGERMGELARDCPKCLLPLNGPEKSCLLGLQLRALQQEGIDRVIVVTGWKDKLVEDYIMRNWPGEAVFVHNHRYHRTNTATSLLMALDHTAAEVALVMNADVFFHPSILRGLCNYEHPSAMVVRPAACSDEEVKVILSETGQVLAVGKGLDPNRSFGEYIGVSKFSKEDRHVLREALSSTVRYDENAYFEDALNSVLHLLDVRAYRAEKPCIEVDYPSDFFEAQCILRILAKEDVFPWK